MLPLWGITSLVTTENIYLRLKDRLPQHNKSNSFSHGYSFADGIVRFTHGIQFNMSHLRKDRSE